MSEKVVLPKFDLPSETMHPAIKATLAVSAFLLLSLAVLGVGIWKRHTAQVEAEARRDAIVAERTAEANAVIEAAKAHAAEVAATQAAAEAAANAKLAAAEADKAKAAQAQKSATVASSESGSRRHGHHHGKAAAKVGKGSALAAKTAADDKKAGPKSTRNNDAIDKLLASFNK